MQDDGIFRDIDAYSATPTGAQVGVDGRPLLAFLKIEKSVLIFEERP